MKKSYIYTLLTCLLLAPCIANAGEDYTITLKDAAFEPEALTIPAGQKVKLTIINANNKAMEFESHEMKREKIIPAKAKASVFVGPLDAGNYSYFDEFQKNVTGNIIVK